MTKTTSGRPTNAEEEMIQDIIETPAEEIVADLREDGLDPDQVVANLRGRLARAQDIVIRSRLEAARTQVPKLSERRQHVVQAREVSGALSAEDLTMAARNATRPMGLSDSTVDEDLAELDSDDWEKE